MLLARVAALRARQEDLFPDKSVLGPPPTSTMRGNSKTLPKKNGTRAVAKILQDGLFEADMVDPNFRDELDMLEAPMLSLDKRKRTQAIEYRGKHHYFVVSANVLYGMATIWDWDFMLWAASQINEAIEAGKPVSRKLRVQPNKYFRQTGKASGKGQYKLFEETINRLKTTSVKTDIQAAGSSYVEWFNWLEHANAIRDEKKRLVYLEVTLCQWFFDRVVADRAVLSISPAYFSITSGIKRWLYRIARKSAGWNTDGWPFTARQLHERYPSGREFRKFKHELKAAVLDDDLPEYRMRWIEGRDPVVQFSLRPNTIGNRMVARNRRIAECAVPAP